MQSALQLLLSPILPALCSFHYFAAFLPIPTSTEKVCSWFSLRRTFPNIFLYADHCIPITSFWRPLYKPESAMHSFWMPCIQSLFHIICRTLLKIKAPHDWIALKRYFQIHIWTIISTAVWFIGNQIFALNTSGSPGIYGTHWIPQSSPSSSGKLCSRRWAPWQERFSYGAPPPNIP